MSICGIPFLCKGSQCKLKVRPVFSLKNDLLYNPVPFGEPNLFVRIASIHRIEDAHRGRFKLFTKALVGLQVQFLKVAESRRDYETRYNQLQFFE